MQPQGAGNRARAEWACSKTTTIMKTIRIILTVGAAALTVITPSLVGAQTVREREQHQQQRIGSGVKDGTLSPAETSRLEKREAELQAQIKADKSSNGGKLTPAERKQIQHELDQISKRIYAAKHDGTGK
jgi:hypothetical protein